MSTPSFILFVDDEQDVLDTIDVMVEEEFPYTSTSNSIEDAKSLLEEKAFSCIVVDININGRNGAEIIKFIREEKPMNNHKAPLIIMSGFINDDFRSKFDNKVEGILAKPFAADDLIKTINLAIKKKNPSKTVQIIHEDNEKEINVFDPQINAPFNIDNLNVNVSRILQKMQTNTKLSFELKKIVESKNHLLMKRIGVIINIASALAKKLHWGSDQTIEKFIYAAYLHDISLGSDTRFAFISTKEDIEEGDFTDEEKELLFFHAKASAKLVNTFGNIPNDVKTIIEQHHESPNGDGFPTGFNHKGITNLSAAFIVAHDLANFILQNQNWSLERFIKDYEKRVEGSQFKKIIKELWNLNR